MTYDERIEELNKRLTKLYRRHRAVIASIERVQAARIKLVRERERCDRKNSGHNRPPPPKIGV